MAKQNHISFEDWVAWMFDRRDRDWAWDVEEDDAPWIRNRRLLTEHFIELHTDPVKPLARYSNHQIGWGLYWLYSSHTIVDAPFLDGSVPVILKHAAIRSVASLIAKLVPVRLSKAGFVETDALSSTLYMFWEVLPLWPFQPTDADRQMQDVCLEEMQTSLCVNHVVARYHALHGLGHFALELPERTVSIIDQWLATSPTLSPSLTEYVQAAREGTVQ